MLENTPLIKVALNLTAYIGFDVYEWRNIHQQEKVRITLNKLNVKEYKDLFRGQVVTHPFFLERKW